MVFPAVAILSVLYLLLARVNGCGSLENPSTVTDHRVPELTAGSPRDVLSGARPRRVDGAFTVVSLSKAQLTE
jgi:hypothetical protein